MKKKPFSANLIEMIKSTPKVDLQVLDSTRYLSDSKFLFKIGRDVCLEFFYRANNDVDDRFNFKYNIGIVGVKLADGTSFVHVISDHTKSENRELQSILVSYVRDYEMMQEMM